MQCVSSGESVANYPLPNFIRRREVFVKMKCPSDGGGRRSSRTLSRSKTPRAPSNAFGHEGRCRKHKNCNEKRVLLGTECNLRRGRRERENIGKSRPPLGGASARRLVSRAFCSPVDRLARPDKKRGKAPPNVPTSRGAAGRLIESRPAPSAHRRLGVVASRSPRGASATPPRGRVDAAGL